jgi:hypothetical protein
MRTERFFPVACLAALLLGSTACSPPVDLAKNVEIVDASTGWADAGLTEDGQNKLVPFVRFKLKNNSDRALPVLQVNAMFLKLGDDKEWGSRFQAVTGSEGLSSGETSKEITLRSDHGLTGTDPRADMMKSSHFVEARVRLTAKYGSVQWVRMAEYPVTHALVE